MGWQLVGSTCIATGDGQRWGRIDLTITPPKLVVKLAAEVFRDQADNKHNVYLWEKGAVEDGSATDWALIRRLFHMKAISPIQKGHLLQGVCNVLTTKAWMWEHGISSDRKCICGQEDTSDHRLLSECPGALRHGRTEIPPTWTEFRTSLLVQELPLREEGLEG